MAGITLVVPGLLGPIAQSSETGFPWPQANALEYLLARANQVRRNGNGLEATLFDMFGVKSADKLLPIAAISYLADFESPPAGNWVRADPVHMQVDQDSALMFAGPAIEVHINEINPICDAFNEIYLDDGYELVPGSLNRWYLRLPEDDWPRTSPLYDLIGLDINYQFPEGQAGLSWRKLLNEIQMMMHAHPVNETRAANGEPALNGVWMWGGGALPNAGTNGITQLLSNNVVARGLAKLHDIPETSLPAKPDEIDTSVQSGQQLVVIDQLRDIILSGALYLWPEWIEQFNQTWISPLLDRVKSGEIDYMDLETCNGMRFRFDKRSGRKFWRRRKALKDFFQ